MKPAKNSHSQSADSFSANVLWLLASTAALLIGLYQAINLRWVSDDAFITFRYVKNFVAGNGIVYNIGEHIEGYTHFLWLILLSAARIVGFDTVDSSIWLGIFSYAGILLLYIFISKQERTTGQSSKIIFPIAAVLLALNYDMATWASGGLETAFYTLLISLAFYSWFYTSFAELQQLLFTGSILALAALTRPDGALFIIIAIVLLIAQGIYKKYSTRSIAKKVALLILPGLVIGIPYALWKYFYYGNLLPNTFYTKSASENYFAQGFFYIWLFFRVYFSAAIACIVFAIFGISRIGRKGFIKKDNDSKGSPIIAASSAIIIYLVVYVAQVGGDFMFGRFIIPVLPLIYYLVERFISVLQRSIKKYQWALAVVFFASVVIENGIREKALFHTDANTGSLASSWNGAGGGEARGIADERFFYYNPIFNVGGIPRGFLWTFSEAGKFYEPFFRGLPAKVVVSAAQNMVGYYANFATCIDEFGLTDSAIAHSPISRRGRIGHEKQGTEEYFASQGVQFKFLGMAPKMPDPVVLGTAVFQIPNLGLYQIAEEIVYDSLVTHELLRRFDSAGVKVALTKYEEVIPLYIANDMEKFSSEQIERDYAKFKKLYFNKYPRPEEQRKIEECIARKKNL